MTRWPEEEREKGHPRDGGAMTSMLPRTQRQWDGRSAEGSHHLDHVFIQHFTIREHQHNVTLLIHVKDSEISDIILQGSGLNITFLRVRKVKRFLVQDGAASSRGRTFGAVGLQDSQFFD